MVQPIIEHDKSDAQKIRDFVGNIPATLTSVYSTSRVNEDIPLHSGVLATNVLGKTLEFEGDIFLDWLPNPRIRLACKLPVTSASFHLFGRANEGANKVLVTLRGVNATAEVLITNPSYSSDFSSKQEVGLNGFFANGITFGSTQGMKSLKFHLPNFPDYDGARTKVEYGAQERADDEDWKYNISHGRADFTSEGWCIVLDRVTSYGKLEKELSQTNGYAITHVGQITREDGSLFSIAEGEKILEALAYFFSFCAATWSCPFLIAGFDEEGAQIWTQWKVPTISRWSNPVSWFSRPSSTVFNQLLPGFLYRWNDTAWQTPLKVIVNWYLQGISPATMDTGFVPPQIALEILAWVLFVQVRQTMTEQEYKKTKINPASKKIEMLLSDAGVSATILPQQSALANLAATIPTSNGPTTLTWLRNSTAHGNRVYDLLSASPEARYQGWQLGVWYLELVLLKLFSYNGRYFNRIGSNRMTGASEPVPWNIPPPATK